MLIPCSYRIWLDTKQLVHLFLVRSKVMRERMQKYTLLGFFKNQIKIEIIIGKRVRI